MERITSSAGGIDRYHDTVIEVAENEYEGCELAPPVSDPGRIESEPHSSVMLRTYRGVMTEHLAVVDQAEH